MEGESQHFLLSAKARTLDLKRVARMSEEEGENAFVAIRYAETDGEPFCHHCQCAVVYRFTRTVTNRKTGEQRKRKLFKCANCLKQFSPTSGTIFASRKLEYRDILLAIALYTNSAKGKAALHLSRDLNVQCKTAFVLEHKLREALGSLQHAQSLSGKVEIDGAYYGGYVKPATRKENRRDLRKLANQSGKRKCVTVMRERNGRTRAFVCSELEGAQRLPSVVEPGSIIFADEAKAYDSLHALFDIKRIDHSKSYAEGEVSTNQAESFHSRMRRAEQGIHHHLSGYTQAYTDEMTWREDFRRLSNGEQFLTITSAAPPRCVADVEGLLAAAEGRRLMATFRFHLIGNAMPVELEVAERSIDDLGQTITQQRFIVGRLTQPDHDGVLPGMLIATARIQCVVET